MKNGSTLTSLRNRIIILCALIALMTVIACSLSATLSISHGFARIDEKIAQRQGTIIDQRLRDFTQQLHYEVDDYANWDELYRYVLTPDPAWAATNLTPGRTPGSLVQYFAVVYQGNLIGRYRSGEVRTSTPSTNDPLLAETFLHLGTQTQQTTGLASDGTSTILYTLSPIRTSARTGPDRGFLIGYRYINSTFLQRLVDDEWHVTLTLHARTPHETPLISTPSHLTLNDRHMQITVPYPLGEWTAQITAQRERNTNHVIHRDIVRSINQVGLGISIFAIFIGVTLGFWWIKPILLLAKSCAEHPADINTVLPTVSGLQEAEILHQSINDLIIRLRANQERLALVLDQHATAHAIHSRFLSQLAHEIGHPLSLMVQSWEKLHAQGGQLDPEQAAYMQQVAQRLEERLNVVLALVPNQRADTPALQRYSLNKYASDGLRVLGPRAAKQNTTINLHAPDELVPINPQLLSPILLNLVANALTACDHGEITVTAQLNHDGHLITWNVSDTGHGMNDELAATVRDACQRGEVLPGTPRLGLGLALILANLRVLGGRLQLVSTSSSGTTFTAIIPFDPSLGSQRDSAEKHTATIKRRAAHPPHA
jgi:signal transduction histidine kinase